MSTDTITGVDRPTIDAGLRVGVMVMADAPMPTLLERFRRLEELGFDQLFLADHLAHPFEPGKTWFDYGSLVGAAATVTERIKIGTMVNNPILRPPALLAREAVTVDHLSGGRLELGIGAGIVELDHLATGTQPWTVRQRVGRFVEYARIVDELLRSTGGEYEFLGAHLQVRGLPTNPGPVQRPRPPIIVGGQAPTILRVAAQRADIWNTIGRLDATVDENIELTRGQNRRLDELTAEIGRDPRSLRRSVAIDPFTAPETFDEQVERFTAVGFDEFFFTWPDDEHDDELTRIAKALPSLR
ncbi:LLM class flavin-dependent oxidoreductase [Phytoactinopolyspora alkaliphila]|uniref:LLM class flavin-dependent oxidoreductase n=1 Tax=Phytoactinopolyspora alkaliphila TaxID=1783498 RepID=A0A6N9YGM6_9ACTN|nr:LLM class flavin-dependent oxidoreductase [Phytoactinopolyspora alkaliphila]NED94077.1 LLM class flavin-dependent oxidoreductase [Phytoactinopolyspora alkaliphila]